MLYFFVDTRIIVKDLEHLLRSRLLTQMSSMALLPQELSRADKRHRISELPSNDIVPLIPLEREVTMGLDLVGIILVHGRLRRRAHSDRLLELGGAA